MDGAEDQRVGRLLVAIRRRTGLRQVDVARAAGVPRRVILDIEAGRAGVIPVERFRRVFEAAGGRARLAVWWNGAAADRLLDERHAAIVEAALAVLGRRGWLVAVEVSFAHFGERGSVDILAAESRTRSLLVVEVKTELGSLEETNRRLDIKVRLGPMLGEERFGWRPTSVSRLLALPATNTARRSVERHRLTMAAAYPARGSTLRAWLRSPQGAIRGIWFLSEVRTANTESGRS